MLLKILLFWEAVLCLWVHGYRRFEGRGVFKYQEIKEEEEVVVVICGLLDPSRMKALLFFIQDVSEKFYGKSTKKKDSKIK
jgi:hypothetical protein